MGVGTLLDAVARGERGAMPELWMAVELELERIGQGEPADSDDSASALVQHTALRLFGHRLAHSGDRNQLHWDAARVVEELLGRWLPVRRLRRPGRTAALLRQDADWLARLSRALRKLEGIAPRVANIARLRLFADVSLQKLAAMVDLPPGVVEADWRFARAWLHREFRRIERGEHADSTEAPGTSLSD